MAITRLFARPALWFTAFVIAGCAGPSRGPDPPAEAARCSSLQGQVLGGGHATVTEAVLVPDSAGVPAYCRATVAMVGSTLRFESRLPLRGWNGKMATLGGGGFKGELLPPTLPYFSRSIIAERYATMATNGGYDYAVRDASYYQAAFARDPVKLDDYAHLAAHRSLPVAKELVARFYGTPVKKNYFEGCSFGGHEGLVLGQRFPQDFDGIVARAPAGNAVGMYLQFNRVSKAQRAPGGSLNAAKQQLLADAVLKQCDAMDGLADGILSKPAACRFDPAPLRCTGGRDAGDRCLSDAQLHTVHTATTGFATKDGRWGHLGINWGGERSGTQGWGDYLWPLPTSPFDGESAATRYAEGFVRSFITRNPTYDLLQFDPDEWLAPLSAVGQQLNATNPDLSAMRARGGKLILWNGEYDAAVSPRETARYYDQVVRTMGATAADDTVEFFLAPGVGHCAGGTAPDRVDLMAALVAWAEHGTSPSRQGVVQSRLNAAGQPVQTRPLCKYPAYPRYDGSGDPKSAQSFRCSTD